MRRSLDAIQLGTIELFCKAAELKSFTATAEVMGLTQGAVSRAIARLEQRLGVQLFQRTTRSIRLTDDGELYRSQCQQALEQIAEAERVLMGQGSEPVGNLRMSVPTTYANFRLLPLVTAFNERYPNVSVDINISNRNVDFVEEGYDLAIRLGEPRDSRIVARRLENASLGIFASPDYLKTHGTPLDLADLQRHQLIQFVRPSTGRPMSWILRHEGQDIDFTFTSTRRVHEDVIGAVNWARAGGGLFQIYHFIAEDYVRQGQLVEVLKSLGGRYRQFNILYPQNRHLSARVRTFVDFLTNNLTQ